MIYRGRDRSWPFRAAGRVELSIGPVSICSRRRVAIAAAAAAHPNEPSW